MERKAERQGRIRAEQDLKKLHYQVAADAATTAAGAAAPPATDGGGDSSSVAPAGGTGPDGTPLPQGAPLSFPFRPIGTIQSCFSQR